MVPLLSLEKITRTFPPRPGQARGTEKARPVLDAVNLSIEQGEIVALVGRSGAGKTTLLYIAGGLAKPDAGRVIFDGRDIAALPPEELARLRRREMGLVFQNNLALSALPVWENAALPLLLEGVPFRDARKRASAALERVGLAINVNDATATLSGGQRRRLGLARAMIASPRLLLADEPTADLDDITAGEMERLLREWLSERKAAALIVTHTSSIEHLAHRVLRLDAGKLIDAAALQSR